MWKYKIYKTTKGENKMKKIIVPKDKCPLEVIAEMGEQTQNAWIFLNKDAINHLRDTAIAVTEYNGYTFNIGGRIVRVRTFSDEWKVLEEVTVGNGIDEFKSLPENPERIFMVEMAK